MEQELLEKIIKNACVHLREDHREKTLPGAHGEVTYKTTIRVETDASKIMGYSPDSSDTYRSEVCTPITRNARILDKEGHMIRQVKGSRETLFNYRDGPYEHRTEGESETVEEALQKTSKRKARYVIIQEATERRRYFDMRYNHHPDTPSGILERWHEVIIHPLEKKKV
ncbi:MAG: hypothetical protein KKD17_05215 [Nanoarchaeota archaeon]|nr:hypothetical protein [Nanoarchaeota archaeon]